MAKQISLNLTINGVKQSVSNINQLEEAVRSAQEELKGMDVGSESFKKLSRDVNQAKSVLKDFEKSVEGQELEQRVGAFAKVGESITSSFAGAQAAISLFGNESEDVALAAAKAQSVLTIALAARSAAEGVVAVRTVAANIATYASEAAAGAATKATRVLYATLAANPYGAILAVIGAVVSALVLLTNESEDLVNVQAELNKVSSEEANALKNTLFILTQMNGQRELQGRELENLKKQYPGFNAFIDKENKLNQDGIKFIKLKIRQYELEAQAKLITQKIAENSIKILEIEGSSILDNVSFWEKAWNQIKTGGAISGSIVADYQTGLQNQREKIAQITTQNDSWRKSLQGVYVESDKVLTELKPFNQALTTQDQINQKLIQSNNTKAQQEKAIAEAYKKGATATIDLSKAISTLNDEFKKYEETIKNLESINYEAPILETLKGIQEARVSAAKELVKGIDLVKKSIVGLSAESLPKDRLIADFASLRKELEDEFAKLGTGKEINFDKVFSQFKEATRLTQDQINILSDLVEGYKQTYSFINETQGFKDYINSLKGVNVEWDNFRQGGEQSFDAANALVMIIGEITAANRAFTSEFTNTTELIAENAQLYVNTPIEILKFDPVKVKKNADGYIKELENALFKPLALRFLQEEIKTQESLLKITPDKVKQSEIQGYIKNLTDQIAIVGKTGQFAANLTTTTGEAVRAEAKKIAQDFVNLTTSIVKAEQKIIAVNNEVQKITKTILSNPTELSKALGGVVLSNIDTISKTLIGVRTQEQKIEKDFIDNLKNDRAGLEKFKNDLIASGIDVEKASYDDLLDAYIIYKTKEVEVTKTAEDEKKKAQEQTYRDILKGFELFSQTLNQISSITNERFQTDIESLKIASKKTQEQVVGNSEKAVSKRLEIETEYNEKIKEIEKKQRISALKFSLVQTIANGAQAIVKSLAELGPIAGPIFAGVNAALTAFQIGVISDQISNAQAMRRGGVLKAQGGMLLSGPSHEGGGIPLAQYGVVAEGQESIINRNSTVNFRDLLSTINQSGGGRPLVVNNFDDTRIVEAIASQRQKPLRAYVLQSEITNEQAISKRLDDLSKF
jgi:hypothetical protein